MELFRIKLHLANCLHLHSLPKSFTSLSRDAAADARHWSRKRAAVSITPLLYYPPQSAFFCSPLPHCENKETSPSDSGVLQFISLQVYLIRTSGPFGRPSLLFPAGADGTPGPGGVVRSCPPPAARSLWGQRVRAARPGTRPLPSPDPLIAPSAVNLSAPRDALTSFFICSSF